MRTHVPEREREFKYNKTREIEVLKGSPRPIFLSLASKGACKHIRMEHVDRAAIFAFAVNFSIFLGF